MAMARRGRLPLMIRHFTNLKLRDQRSVSRQNSKITIFAGHLNVVNLLAEKKSGGSDNF
jgi:hypothetical protein